MIVIQNQITDRSQKRKLNVITVNVTQNVQKTRGKTELETFNI